VRIETFGLAERNGGGRQRLQLLRATFKDGGALHEVEHAQPRGEARRACRRQHMIRACDIVANRLRGVRADENRTGIADAARQFIGPRARDFDVLRRERIDECNCLSEIGDENDGAEIAPGRTGNGGAP